MANYRRGDQWPIYSQNHISLNSGLPADCHGQLQAHLLGTCSLVGRKGELELNWGDKPIKKRNNLSVMKVSNLFFQL
jgi:hypothetical protein